VKKLILLLTLGISMTGWSQTALPSFFSNGMVLQQNEEVSIWGTDDPETKISVKAGWGKKVKAEAGPEGKWKIKLATPQAGGPYEIKINGSEEMVLKDVLIGEVWLASGQSNMDMPLKGFPNQPVTGSNEAILHFKK
jgi:sialate O-acetylesterase